MNIDYLYQTSCYDCINCKHNGYSEYDNYCTSQCNKCSNVLSSGFGPYYSYEDLGHQNNYIPNKYLYNISYNPLIYRKSNYIGSYY